MKYFYLLIFCLLANLVKAQDMDTAKYNHMVDFVACKVIKYLIPTDAETRDFTSKCHCSDDAIESTKIVPFLETSHHPRPNDIALASQILKLKQYSRGIGSPDKKVFFTQSIFENVAETDSLQRFKQRQTSPNQKAHFEKLIEEISNEVARIYKQSNQTPHQIIPPKAFQPLLADSSLTTQVTSLSQRLDKLETANSMIIVALIVFAGLFVFFFFKGIVRERKHVEPQSNTEVDEHKKRTRDIVFELQTKVNNIDARITSNVERLNGAIAAIKPPTLTITGARAEAPKLDNAKLEAHDKAIMEIRLELKQIANKPATDPNQVPGKKSTPGVPLEIMNPEVVDLGAPPIQYVSPATFLPTQGQEVLYLATPAADGSFDTDGVLHSYKEGASIYKVVKTTMTSGKFQIDEHETAVKLALQYISTIILPCCIPKNAYDPIYKKIRLLNTGLIEQQGDKWVVTKKAEIIYES